MKILPCMCMSNTLDHLASLRIVEFLVLCWLILDLLSCLHSTCKENDTLDHINSCFLVLTTNEDPTRAPDPNLADAVGTLYCSLMFQLL